MVGPDGQPPTFDGASWISRDGRYWWNGAAWQPIGRRAGPNFFVIGMALVILASGALVITGIIRPDKTNSPAAPVVMGVTNAKIDSSTKIEFDYAMPTTCSAVQFQVVFYDSAGHAVGNYVTQMENNVTGGVTHHFVFTTNDTIPSSAVRFVATANCLGSWPAA